MISHLKDHGTDLFAQICMYNQDKYLCVLLGYWAGRGGWRKGCWCSFEDEIACILTNVRGKSQESHGTVEEKYYPFSISIVFQFEFGFP